MTNLILHLADIQDRANLLVLALTGLRTDHGLRPGLQDDLDAVVNAAEKLADHIHGVRCESTGDEGRS